MAEESSGITGLSERDEVEMFRSLALSCPDGVVVADSDGVVIWANDVAHSLFGRPASSMPGSPLTSLVPDDLHDDALELRHRVLRGEQPGGFVTTGLRSDGTRFPCLMTPAIRRSEGRVLGINAIVRDLSQDLRVQHDLTEALARFRARFDQVAKPQALLDLDARFVEVNDAACRLIGWQRSDLIGRDARDLIEPVDPVTAAIKLAGLNAGNLPAVGFEAVAARPDGGDVPVLLDISVVRDADGAPRELAVFADDLSDVQEAKRRIRDQDAFFRVLYQKAADPALVVDAETRICYVSPAFTEVSGYPAAEVIGRRYFELLHPDDAPAAREVLANLVTRHRASERLLVRALDATGEWRWFDGVATNGLDDPVIGGIVLNLREVTTEVEARERLRSSENRYRTIVETAQEGIILVTPTGEILFANDEMVRILGVDVAELYAKGLFSLLSKEEARDAERRLDTRQDVGAERFEVIYHHPATGRRTLAVAASPMTAEDGSMIASLGMMSDVTAERQAQSALRHQSLHDSLTGLPNRALLTDRLTMAGARQQRDDKRGLAVLFLDLDHFKLVNDSHGHDAGDRLLIEVAARLETAVRDTDTVARLGGDEFAVVCEESSADDAETVAERIQLALSRPFDVAGERVYVSASIGVALSPPHRVGDLLRFADAAMYQAKASGRSRVTSFEDGQADLGERRLAISGALREALVDESLTMGYQPILDLESLRVLGLEALLRWTHPTLGRVGPEEILVAADTAGLSWELDRAVIRASARDMVTLRELGVVTGEAFVSVNVSSRTAQQQRLEEIVQETLEATGLPASCLSLEITEHAIMDNADHAVALLTRLTESGVGVAIDDFGTGYNSLVHLQRLPAGTLKIDRSFVSAIHHGQASRVIAQSIVSLADALGMTTIAEGVETPEQLDALREIGARAGQGYLWAPAVMVEDLPETLDRLRR